MDGGTRRAGMSDAAVLLCGHGSRDPEAIAEFEVTAAALRARLEARDFATGYLEFAHPTISEALAELTARGARHILVIPAMLFAASHVKRDLPRELSKFRAATPGIDVRPGRDLGIDARLLDVAMDRIAAVSPAERSDALLIVVGRGASDPDANAKLAEIAAILGERMSFAVAQAAFSGIAHPRIDTALDSAVQRGFRRIVVFPYFLFGGVLVKRLRGQTEDTARRFPEVEFVTAGHLCDHAGVIDVFVDRVTECAAMAEPEQESCSTPS
jgi:sirohydrochlorin cobaltochelatase